MSIPYGRQTIGADDIKAVTDTLNSEYLTTGPKIKEFEEKFAKLLGVKYAVAVSNGTAALHLACLAAGLKKGDELITTPMTFAASANCALYCDAKPVFVDIKENGLIDEDLIEAKITQKTKIIIPVHYGGLPCDLKKIKSVAKKHNLIIIEDACHALGSEYMGSKIGDCAYSDMAVFSFHPVKHITTGEGGMITTNSPALYEKLLLLRTHGITKNPDQLINKNEGPWFYEMQELGYNYRITDLQCALGISQLKRVKSFVKKRILIAKKYDKGFKDKNIEIIQATEGIKNAYHLYIIKTQNKLVRLRLFNYLKEHNILCQVHYVPVYWHPYYQKLGYKKGICPKAEEFYGKIISIPMYPDLTAKEQDKIIALITSFVKKRKILAVIPARGGSKRIPRKNIKNFLGKPIIAYSIHAALKSGIFDEVMVSTDDTEIAGMSLKYGAKVPFMRSPKNSGDMATTADVLREVLAEYKKRGNIFDYVCCIYATAPFVTPEKLIKAKDLYEASGADTVMPVAKYSVPIQRSFKLKDNGTLSLNWPDKEDTRSQDLEQAYHDAGQYYFLDVNKFLTSGKIFADKTVPVITYEMEVQDLDNNEDWEIAEAKYAILKNNGQV